MTRSQVVLSLIAEARSKPIPVVTPHQVRPQDMTAPGRTMILGLDGTGLVAIYEQLNIVVDLRALVEVN